MNNLNKLKTIAFCLILVFGVSVVSAKNWTGPTSSPPNVTHTSNWAVGNKLPPVTTLSVSQYKSGGLAIGTSSTTNLTNYNLAVAGNILTGGLAVVNSGADIEGSVKSSSLSYTKASPSDPDKRVCVDSTGKLTIVCSGYIETSTYTYTIKPDATIAHRYYYGKLADFTVPSNLYGDKITVEIWGGGGSDYNPSDPYYGNGLDMMFGPCADKSLCGTIMAYGGKAGISSVGGSGGTVSTPAPSSGQPFYTYSQDTSSGKSGASNGKGGEGGHIKFYLLGVTPGQILRTGYGHDANGGASGTPGIIKLTYLTTK